MDVKTCCVCIYVCMLLPYAWQCAKVCEAVFSVGSVLIRTCLRRSSKCLSSQAFNNLVAKASAGPVLGGGTDFGISNICMLVKVNCKNQRKLTAEISGSEQVDEFAYSNRSASRARVNKIHVAQNNI